MPGVRAARRRARAPSARSGGRTCRSRAARRRRTSGSPSSARRAAPRRRACARPRAARPRRRRGSRRRAPRATRPAGAGRAAPGGRRGRGRATAAARAAARDRRRRSTGPRPAARDGSPKWRRMPSAAALRALDPRPHGAVLAPARLRPLAGGGAAGGERAPVPGARRRGPVTRSGGEGDGWITPARARWPTIARTASSSAPPATARSSCSPTAKRPSTARPSSRLATVAIAPSSTVERSMKKTCRPLSRLEANSRQRAGLPSRPARPASW